MAGVILVEDVRLRPRRLDRWVLVFVQ